MTYKTSDIHMQRPKETTMNIPLNDKAATIFAHEIRNPLMAMGIAVAMICRLKLEEPRLTEACQILKRQSLWLNQLLENLGQLTRLDTESMQLHRKVVDLGEVAFEAIELCEPLFNHYGHRVSKTRPQVSTLVAIDRTRILQVLMNLLTNAAKYTPPGGRISVEVRDSSTEASVAVRDNGRGIPADQLPNIFQWFTRGDDHEATGWGVGLALVKCLVELHQGWIDVDSAGSGLGAEFTIYLPKSSETILD